MGKKNLEQLFKETFEGFQETPDDRVWESIEVSLDKKKRKKRIVPIWWQLGGVAALLAILFYIINPLGTEQDDQIIISDTETPVQKTGADENSSHQNNSSTNESAQGLVESTSATEKSKQNGSESNFNQNQSMASKDQLANTDSPNNKAAKVDQGVSIKSQNQKGAALAMNKNVSDDVESTITDNNTTEAIAQNKAPNQSNKEQIISEGLGQENQEESIATNQNEQPEKKSIYDAIKEQEDEEAIVANTNSGKWSVGPSVAPVYFNATGGGSPIHSDFASNSKSGNFNLSYGLTVAYEVGKKVKVRSGVHRVNYGYDTNDVVFSSSSRVAADEKLDNINYSQKSQTVVVQSKNNLPDNLPTDAFLELASNAIPVFDGKMVQQLGYIEVPLEVDYALIDRKFGVDLIGGVSSLFLVDNSVLLEAEGLVTEIGEATNANDVNFSANFGMGFNYKFTPKVQLNIEPVFKYQMNTFSKTAGQFQPFSVGVYSGVSFKF
ncbi:hypothetical protein [Flagellimonas olearia]|uniref:Outer membrane protein beta-barrel domain-containing protein n=1 Tax=Flagellimonas olearia TaxID=552546 RepID=A0A444VNR2_9FLAO|nr:hypothetical protein [Allomuricauda olearia]RYC52441.1 hypothetical protein DN53_11250 [Allomuricauda olearia]